MYDSRLMLRAAAAGALDGNETGAFKEFGPMGAPLVLLVHIPQAEGTSPTLDLTFDESTDGVNADGPVHTMAQITEAGPQKFPLRMGRGSRFLRFAAVTGGSSPDFGVVEIGPVFV